MNTSKTLNKKSSSMTLGFDYVVAIVKGVLCLVHQFDLRIAAIRLTPENRHKVTTCGEGHFTYADARVAALSLRELL